MCEAAFAAEFFGASDFWNTDEANKILLEGFQHEIVKLIDRITSTGALESSSFQTEQALLDLPKCGALSTALQACQVSNHL